MTIKPLMAVLLAASLSFPAIGAEARGTANQKKATLAGAAAGAVVGGLLGNDGQSAIIGAVAGDSRLAPISATHLFYLTTR